MKLKIFVIAALLTGFIFASNYTYSSFTKLDDPKCKCVDCKCTDCKCGTENCCCKEGKCDNMNGCSKDGAKCEKKADGCCKKDAKCEGMKGTKCEGMKDCKMKKKEGESQGMPSDTLKTALVCPVSGETIDGAEGEPVKLTYLGKEYTFCCNGCVKKFKTEPMKYIKEDLNCPVMGETAKKDVFTVVNGVKYYFCCEKCIAKFEKDPDKYLKK